MRLGCPTIMAVVVLFMPPARAQALTLKSAPPVVVKTVPQAGAGDADPATAEVSVTFSEPMQDGSWSRATANPETFPGTVGKLSYLDDQRTCVCP